MTVSQKETLNKKIDTLEGEINEFVQKTLDQPSENQKTSIDYDEVLIAKENEIIGLQRRINTL